MLSMNQANSCVIIVKAGEKLTTIITLRVGEEENESGSTTEKWGN